MSRCLILLALMLMLPGLLWGETRLLDIEADRVEKNQAVVEASGNVVVTGEDMHLTCDYLLYDSVTGDLWATGDCRLTDPKGEIKASTIQYNQKRNDAQIENGSILVYAEPMLITGSLISRYGNDLYLGEDLTYTPCLGEKPAWSIRATRLKIPLEGYGTAEHARFQVHDFPLVYIPYLLFPAKLERQSGLLFPAIGSSSDTGFRLGLPVYLTLGRSADVTLTPTYLAERGFLAAGEMRYRLDERQQGQLYAEFLSDKKGGERLEGGVLDERPDRRWYVKATQLGGDLTWDVNLVSNPDYFRDIGPLYVADQDEQWIGNQQSKTEMQLSRVQWMQTWGGFSLNLSSQYEQDLTVADDDDTLQELPRIMARMAQREIPYTPLRVAAEVNSVKLASQEWVRGIKDYGLFEISLPYSFGPYGTVRPFIDEIYRDTRFSDKQDYEHGVYAEHWQQRGVTLSTSLYSPRFYQNWYHQLVPAIDWKMLTRWGGNTDETDESGAYPVLLAGDDWTKKNDIQLSLSNYIRNDTGASIIEIDLERSYSIKSEWGLYELTARVTPNQWISIKHTQKFGKATDPITGLSAGAFATQEHTTTISLRNGRGDELSVREEYNRIDTRLLYGRTKINLLHGIGLLAEAKYDFNEDRFEFIRQGISYDTQCWGVMLRYDIDPRDEDDDTPRKTTISLGVKLLGLGDVKTSRRLSGE